MGFFGFTLRHVVYMDMERDNSDKLHKYEPQFYWQRIENGHNVIQGKWRALINLLRIVKMERGKSFSLDPLQSSLWVPA